MISQSMQDRRYQLFGVEITDVSRSRAVDLLEQLMRGAGESTSTIYFVNAHTLNLAVSDPAYRDTLNAATHVFGDGTGVRWAARRKGIAVRDNLVGTDLVPALLEQKAGRGYSYYLLGSDAATVTVAAQYALDKFPGWKQTGFHHGYLDDHEVTRDVVQRINATDTDVLLVGMGNPREELWLQRHRDQLSVPVSMAIGGLFDYWAGNVSRAPQWIRQMGHEWAWRLLQQPRDKARRYLLGNPLFLWRMLWDEGRHRGPDSPVGPDAPTDQVPSGMPH